MGALDKEEATVLRCIIRYDQRPRLQQLRVELKGLQQLQFGRTSVGALVSCTWQDDCVSVLHKQRNGWSSIHANVGLSLCDELQKTSAEAQVLQFVMCISRLDADEYSKAARLQSKFFLRSITAIRMQ